MRRGTIAMILWMGLLATTLGQTACRRSHVQGTVSTDAVIQAFTDIGFGAETVKTIDPEPWGAGNCSQGSVSGLDVLVCEFEADDVLAAAEQKIRDDWNANNVDTGVVTRSSRTLLSVADRQKVDVGGRKIVRLLAAFRELH
jgi:hypothetical protein